jgi:hypothetical protein
MTQDRDVRTLWKIRAKISARSGSDLMAEFYYATTTIDGAVEKHRLIQSGSEILSVEKLGTVEVGR